MPIETNIILELRTNRVYDNTVYVSRNTKVRFIARIFWKEFLSSYKIRDNFSIILYFQDRTPTGFDTQRGILFNEIPKLFNLNNNESYDFILSEGVVNEPGEYKYGFRATTERGEKLFDEDPYLIVS